MCCSCLSSRFCFAFCFLLSAFVFLFTFFLFFFLLLFLFLFLFIFTFVFIFVFALILILDLDLDLDLVLGLGLFLVLVAPLFLLLLLLLFLRCFAGSISLRHRGLIRLSIRFPPTSQALNTSEPEAFSSIKSRAKEIRRTAVSSARLGYRQQTVIGSSEFLYTRATDC